MTKFSFLLLLLGILIVLIIISIIIFSESCITITEHPPDVLQSCDRDTLEDVGCMYRKLPFDECSPSIWSEFIKQT